MSGGGGGGGGGTGGVEVVVAVVVVEHQHLLLTSLAVLDMLVLYHEDRHQFRVFLHATLKKTHLALKTPITACCLNYRMPHLLEPSLNPTVYDVYRIPALSTVIRRIASFPERVAMLLCTKFNFL